MMAEVQLQIYRNSNEDDEQEQGQPSSSSRHPESSSVRSPSSLPSGSDSLPRITTLMNAKHYSILFKNNDSELRTQINDVTRLCTESDSSTLLHIAASVGKLDFIDSILQQSAYHDLLHGVPNSQGDLPIHAAARACQLEAVKRLVIKAEDLGRISMLEVQNEDKNTALHIALENHQQQMANSLFEKSPNTSYRLNSKQFSPLYLAIKAQFWDLVTAMLSRHPHPTDDADADAEAEAEAEAVAEAVACLIEGKSVVHAAIDAHRKDILEAMLEKYGDELMYNARDEMGRTPLSYAAYVGFHDWVNYMINTEKLRNQAYVIDEKGCFPIHWACRGGNMEVVKLFFNSLVIGSYPEKARLLNNMGQNILHVAAASGKSEIVKYILQQPELKTMINMKDKDGNTPFHLASQERHPRVVYLFTWDNSVKLNIQNKHDLTALDIAEEYADVPSFEQRLTWLFLRCAGVPRTRQLHYLNTGGINEAEISDNTIPNVILQIPKKRKTKYKERINTLLVVSILVATVAFTSGFTLPGGYKNNNPDEGMATLAHKFAFQVFVITNTVALHSSILASVTLIWAHLDDLRLTALSLQFALPLLGTALAMMSVAFTAGLYVVLHDVIGWLGIVVLVMGGVFLVTLLIFFIPLYSPTSCIRNRILRYVLCIPFTLMLLACEKGKERATLCY